MNGQHTRMSRWVAWIGIAGALAAPAAAAGGSDGTGSSARAESTLRNDIAHFGISSSPREQSNATLRNDQAHYGTNQRSTTSTSMVQSRSPAPVVVRVDGGFDWVSAGVGAAGGLGFVLMAAAAAYALRRRLRVEAAQT